MVRIHDVVHFLPSNTANNESQVLHKRKPVLTIPHPDNLTDNTEVWLVSSPTTVKSSDTLQVWVLRGTNEIFTDYEKFIKRYVRNINVIMN